MPYRLKRKETVAEGIRRIAREEAGKALAADGDGTVGERIHAARTRCKRLRGLLRLVGPHLGDASRRENAFLRDAARPLSALRDSAVTLEAFDDLARRGRLAADAAEAVRRLVANGPAAGHDAAERLAGFVAAMHAFRDRIDDWRIDARGFSAVEDGLTRVYRRGRKAMRTALETNDDSDRHEWRKQAKYHWYHVRLLRGVWRPAMDARQSELERLSDLLGDDHDLAVLRTLVGRATDLEPHLVEPVLSLIDRRRRKLSAAAASLGTRIHAEKPAAFSSRMRRYWKTWRAEAGT